MKNILSLIAMMLLAVTSWSQAAFVLPSPTNANDSVTIYIDISKSTSNGLKHMIESHPEVKDEVYMWTWSPAGPACGNGDWGNSNDCMKMKRVSGMIYSMKIVPTSFYSCTPLDLYSKGISCLAKLDNGNAFGSDGVGEAKTEDLHIDILPALCADKFCYFPEASRIDDFFTITYDNSKETDANLQNLGPDDCYIYMAARAGINIYPVSQPADVTTNPALKMEPLATEPGKFRLTIIPSEFFTTNGANVQEIWFYIVKPGYLPVPPITTKYAVLNCN
jgi:hypothetical protein